MALALVGFVVAGYLTLFQLGTVGDVWEPFFGDGSRRILTSEVSNTLPVPDAALGAAGYLADAVTGVIGSRRRWHTIPWMVVLFGVAIGPLEAASVVLVILQPVLFDAFCTLCLASAVISLVMIGPARWTRCRKPAAPSAGAGRGRLGMARVLGPAAGDGTGSPEPRGCRQAIGPFAEGTRLMWPRAVAAGAGIWLMAAPSVLGYGDPAAATEPIVGPLAAALAIVAMAQVTRPLRWTILPLGLLLAVAPLLLGYGGVALANEVLSGVVLAATSFPRGRITERFGGGWRSVVRPPQEGE